MKEKRENYVKPQSYVIESEQPLMSGSAPSIGGTEHRPGRMVALVCFLGWGYFGLEQYEVLNVNPI